MVSASDYGSNGDSTLVPGALTAYRHFYLSTRPMTPGGRLLPMHQSWRSSTYIQEKEKVFEARCEKPMSGIGRVTSRPEHKTPAPQLDCSCGFYAHYFPETDFYPDATWVARDGFDQRGMSIMVRTVVEMSGRIVAGALGVRAQKMRIKAMSVDWGKYQPPGHLLTDVDLLDFSFENPFRIRRPRRPEPYVVGYCHQVLETAARSYGAEWYTDAREMYCDHPQQNLANVGINAKTERQVREERERKAREDLERMRAKLAALPGAIDEFSADFAGAAAVLRRAAACLDDDRLTPMQRAIEAKKNRPAPPGAGIDRRRRKL